MNQAAQMTGRTRKEKQAERDIAGRLKGQHYQGQSGWEDFTVKFTSASILFSLKDRVSSSESLFLKLMAMFYVF